MMMPAKTSAKKTTINTSDDIPNIFAPETRTAPRPDTAEIAKGFDSVPANQLSWAVNRLANSRRSNREILEFRRAMEGAEHGSNEQHLQDADKEPEFAGYR
jgi:hypothetical protein